MADTKLQTILHISDLHFGDGGKDADIRQPVIDGFLGHHWRAIEQLEGFVRHLMQRDPHTQLVVSGDLTANGEQHQFDSAKDILGSGPSTSGFFGLELGFVNWLEKTVPGNHDLWPGLPPQGGFRNIFGSPTQAFKNTFPGPYPTIMREGASEDQNTALCYILINTEAEVDPKSLDRTLARGKFPQQLADLDALLPSRPKNEIRILVMHHAIIRNKRGMPPGRVNFPRKSRWAPPLKWEIESLSSELLEKAIVRHEIQIVMSGHIHTPLLTTITASSKPGIREFLDARCGTTTQLDKYPQDFLQSYGSPVWTLPSLDSNSLILHELWRYNERLVWEAQVFRRSPIDGFVTYGQLLSFDLT